MQQNTVHITLHRQCLDRSQPERWKRANIIQTFKKLHAGTKYYYKRSRDNGAPTWPHMLATCLSRDTMSITEYPSSRISSIY